MGGKDGCVMVSTRTSKVARLCTRKLPAQKEKVLCAFGAFVGCSTLQKKKKKKGEKIGQQLLCPAETLSAILKKCTFLCFLFGDVKQFNTEPTSQDRRAAAQAAAAGEEFSFWKEKCHLTHSSIQIFCIARIEGRACVTKSR